MLTFFALIAVVNMALGFGLAIYLGHTGTIEIEIPRLEFSRFGSRATPIGSTADSNGQQAVSAISTQPEVLQAQIELPSASAGQRAPSNAADAATEDGPVSEGFTPAGPADHGPASEQPMADDPIADPDSQPPSEEELLAGITTFRSELAAAIPEAEQVAS